jgi:ribonuclease E
VGELPVPAAALPEGPRPDVHPAVDMGEAAPEGGEGAERTGRRRRRRGGRGSEHADRAPRGEMTQESGEAMAPEGEAPAQAEPRQAREPRPEREPREHREPRLPREPREHREPRADFTPSVESAMVPPDSAAMHAPATESTEPSETIAPTPAPAVRPAPATAFKPVIQHEASDEDQHRPVRRRRHEGAGEGETQMALQLVETQAAAPAVPAEEDTLPRRTKPRRRRSAEQPNEPLQMVETQPASGEQSPTP